MVLGLIFRHSGSCILNKFSSVVIRLEVQNRMDKNLSIQRKLELGSVYKVHANGPGDCFEIFA